MSGRLVSAKLKQLAVKHVQGELEGRIDEEVVPRTKTSPYFDRDLSNNAYKNDDDDDTSSSDTSSSSDPHVPRALQHSRHLRIIRAFEQGKKSTLADQELALMDIDSTAFHQLPLDMQQEILQELKARSIRPSWYRMNEYFDTTNDAGQDGAPDGNGVGGKSALEFSKLQVQNVLHRRKLYSRLQELQQQGRVQTEDGSVIEKRRIDAEKNRAYVLVKNENMPTWSLKLADDDQNTATKGDDVKEAAKAPVEFAVNMPIKTISEDQLVNYLEVDDDAIADSLFRDATSHHPGSSSSPHLLHADNNKAEGSVMLDTKLEDQKTQMYQKWLLDLPDSASLEDETWVHDAIYTFTPKRIQRQYNSLCRRLGKRSVVHPVSGYGDGHDGDVDEFKKQCLEDVMRVRRISAEYESSDDEDNDDQEEVIVVSAVHGKMSNQPMLNESTVVIGNVQSEPSVDVEMERPELFKVVEHEPAASLVSPTNVCSNDITDQQTTDKQEFESSTDEQKTIDGKDKQGESQTVDEESDSESEHIREELTREQQEFSRFISSLQPTPATSAIAPLPTNPPPPSLSDLQLQADADIQFLTGQHSRHTRDMATLTPDLTTDIQTLLTLFGIPFVTAPGEAEAQCSILQQSGVVDGIVTDDSDVFLFGGDCVYKNLFHGSSTSRRGQQQKFVECYMRRDLESVMGLGRLELIQLAYLMGSDYTEGIDGVGAVLAMEIVAEWYHGDGEKEVERRDGDELACLRAFAEWWKLIIERGGPDATSNSTGEEEEPATRRKLRKSVAKLILPDAFPDPAILHAYTHPLVHAPPSSSQSTLVGGELEWQFPRLDRVRAYLMAKLGWDTHRIDATVLPIIKNMGVLRAQQQSSQNQHGQHGYGQGNGHGVTSSPLVKQVGGNGVFRPRIRDAVETLLEKKRGSQSGGTDEDGAMHNVTVQRDQESESLEESDEAAEEKSARKKLKTGSRSRGGGRGKSRRGRGGRGGGMMKSLKQLREEAASKRNRA